MEMSFSSAENALNVSAVGATARGEGALPSGAAPSAGLAPTVAPAVATGGALVSSSGDATALPEYSLARAPDDPEFPQELTARMKTLVRDGMREARLQLHPAELGRLQVTVTTEGDQTKVAFAVETASAKDAIEQSLPRLRDMLEQSGLQLAQSDVGQQNLSEGGKSGHEALRSDEEQVSQSDQADEGISVGIGISSSRVDTYI